MEATELERPLGLSLSEGPERMICDGLLAALDEVQKLRAAVKICHPPLPVRMVQCGIYCATAKELLEENERLRAAMNEALPFTMSMGQKLLAEALGPNS